MIVRVQGGFISLIQAELLLELSPDLKHGKKEDLS